MKEIIRDLGLMFLLIVFILVIIIQGAYRYNTTPHSDDVTVTEWISPDGVHYWYEKAGYHAMLAPRYDKDGELVIE